MSLTTDGSSRTLQQLVRYEALFKLLDEIQGQEDISALAQPVARQWKYFSNVTNWRLVVVNGTRYKRIDGSRGQAQACDVDTLTGWDAHHWTLHKPHLHRLDTPGQGPEPPAFLLGPGVSEVMVLPFERSGGRIGLLSAAARHRPFDDLDTKFMRIFGSHFAERVFDLVYRARTTKALVERATHDALTGLLNRGAVLERLHELLAQAQRSSQPVSVLLCDVDFFKIINDNHGHLAGDAVLRELSRRLTVQLRTGDCLGRYGGEEFLIVLHPCSAESAMIAAERFRRAVADWPFEIDSAAAGGLAVSISLGAATHTSAQAGRLEELLKRADDALYLSKAHGRNRVTGAPG